MPPLVEFGWGVYRFTGMVEQYKETLDFFAAGGVPLRAGVNLTLSSQDVVFEQRQEPERHASTAISRRSRCRCRPSTGPAGGPAGVANALGDPRAARAIASANGVGQPALLRRRRARGRRRRRREPVGAAAAFSAGASAGFGAGVSGGVGLGISGGAGVGVSAGAGFGVSAASAGFGAAAGVGVGGRRQRGCRRGIRRVGRRGSLGQRRLLRPARRSVDRSVSMPVAERALALTRGCRERRRRAVRARRTRAVERLGESLGRRRRQCRADGAARIRRVAGDEACVSRDKGQGKCSDASHVVSAESDADRLRRSDRRDRPRARAAQAEAGGESSPATRTSAKRCDARFT